MVFRHFQGYPAGPSQVPVAVTVDQQGLRRAAEQIPSGDRYAILADETFRPSLVVASMVQIPAAVLAASPDEERAAWLIVHRSSAVPIARRPARRYDLGADLTLVRVEAR